MALQEVVFKVPENFVVINGVAVFAGYTVCHLKTTPKLRLAVLEETAEWDKVTLLREGLRATEKNIEQLWEDSRGME